MSKYLLVNQHIFIQWFEFFRLTFFNIEGWGGGERNFNSFFSSFFMFLRFFHDKKIFFKQWLTGIGWSLLQFAGLPRIVSAHMLNKLWKFGHIDKHRPPRFVLFVIKTSITNQSSKSVMILMINTWTKHEPPIEINAMLNRRPKNGLVRGVLGNKCARQHNFKTVQIREIMWK